MADIASVAQARETEHLGFDVIGTTLYGYTDASRGRKLAEQDFAFLREVLAAVSRPVQLSWTRWLQPTHHSSGSSHKTGNDKRRYVGIVGFLLAAGGVTNRKTAPPVGYRISVQSIRLIKRSMRIRRNRRISLRTLTG